MKLSVLGRVPAPVVGVNDASKGLKCLHYFLQFILCNLFHLNAVHK